MSMKLVWPSMTYLESYARALETGWSPDTTRPAAAQEELARIATDPQRFVDEMVDLEAQGPPVTLRDGSIVDRIPGYRRWMWDGEFCGSIGFRWLPGTTDLPPHVLGHIGYSVVPWKQGNGYATRALRLLLDDIAASEMKMEFVELSTPVDNIASQRVIEANGGDRVGTFEKIKEHGGGDAVRYRIYLA